MVSNFAPYVYNQLSTPKEDIDAAQDFKVFVTDNHTKIMLSTAANMLDAQRLLKVFVTRYTKISNRKANLLPIWE